jgi:hypothetical protein
MTGEFFALGRTISIIDILPNNKNKESLNMFTNDITVQDNVACSFNPDGAVNLIQKFVEVVPKTVQDRVCYKDLEKTYLAMMMKDTEIPFEKQLAESYVNKVRRYIEIFLWNGDENYDGLVKQIADDTDVIDASAEVEAAGTAMGKVKAMINKMTADILESDDIRLFVPTTFYLQYVQELIDANKYFMPKEYNTGDPMAQELLIPGTTVKITPVLGLDKVTNVTVDDGELLILTYSKNLVASFDGVSGETERFSMIVNPYNANSLDVNIEFKIGSAFKWGDKIIKGYTTVSES